MSDTKYFVITGITSGLGLALARKLLKDGHSVFGCGRREDPLSSEEKTAFADRYSFQSLDIMDFESVRAWAEKIMEKPVDYLIHNAAVIHSNSNLWEIDRYKLHNVIDINIKGTFNILQAFVPLMMKVNKGMVLTLSSGAGRMGIPTISGYCASKWAVEGLTKSLAKELPDTMAAIPLSPGIVDTDMLRTNFGDMAADYPKPDKWSEIAVPYILGLRVEQNGESLTVPTV